MRTPHGHRPRGTEHTTGAHLKPNADRADRCTGLRGCCVAALLERGVVCVEHVAHDPQGAGLGQ